METSLILAALASAVLHAGWNAFVKISHNPAELFLGQTCVAALLTLPFIAVVGLPDSAALPWIAASAILSAFAVRYLLLAYAEANFGIVYPSVRGSAVLFVVPLAGIMTNEWPGPAGLAGILLIAAGVMLLALGGKDSAGGRKASRKALGHMLISSLCIAAYVVCDAQGVRRSGSVIAYALLINITHFAVFAWFYRATGSPIAAAIKHIRLAVPLAMAGTASYFLILWVWMHAPIAWGAALRDTSALFAAAISVIFLKEALRRQEIAAVIIATSGVILLRLA